MRGTMDYRAPATIAFAKESLCPSRARFGCCYQEAACSFGVGALGEIDHLNKRWTARVRSYSLEVVSQSTPGLRIFLLHLSGVFLRCVPQLNSWHRAFVSVFFGGQACSPAFGFF